jgi:hypothetical protein
MKIISLLFILLCTPAIILRAQTVSGRVENEEDGAPVTNVLIQNLNHKDINTVSDEKGHYSIETRIGDSLRFSLLGFSSRVLIFNGENGYWFKSVLMKTEHQMLDNVVIKAGPTKYQQDSIDNRSIFGKKVDEKPIRFGLSKSGGVSAGNGGFGIKLEGILSAPLQRMSKSYKRQKRFQKRYKADEKQFYIDSRYIADSVTVLTGLKGDAVNLFMQVYPMSYEYAKGASDMEIKMWIKYNYKLWMKREP